MGLVREHLRALEGSFAVSRVEVDENARYFPGGPLVSPPLEREAFVWLKRDVSRRILCLLLREGGLTSSDIAARIEAPRAVVAMNLRRMARSGLVQRIPEGAGRIRFSLREPQLVERVLAHVVAAAEPRACRTIIEQAGGRGAGSSLRAGNI